MHISMAAQSGSSLANEEINEAEEEALLKSDDEYDAARLKPTAPLVLDIPASAPITLTDEDSLMSEAALLAARAQAVLADANFISPQVATLIDEDSLMNEAAQLADQDEVEEGISEDGSEGKEELAGEESAGDSDDDDDDPQLQKYKSILKELEQNKFAYDKYVALCEISHDTNDLDNIRDAYKRFSAVYPLSPDLWLKYLNVETNVALSATEIQKVEQLFKRALADYYSVDVALQYAKLAPRTAAPERVWQELLGTYGLHCLRGREFYTLYRQFLSSGSHKLSAAEQQDAYIQSYLRELRYPLHNMEESYIEFKVFYEKRKAQLTHSINWEVIDREYYKAKDHLQNILPFEQQLLGIDVKSYSERAAVYAKYIAESDKFLDENVLQTVYERMVADCCLNVHCWLTYIEFLEYRDEFGRPKELQQWPVFQQSAVDVCVRALRNCTWAEQLYIKRMQLLEQQKKSREEVQEVLESSMSAGFQTAEPAVAIWLEYLTYLRRQTDWDNEGECEILRKNFNLAWTILGQQWGVLADCNCEILQFWGRLEYGPLQDAKRGRELWTTVMESSDNATKSALWIEFTQLELCRDIEATRKLYQRALHATGLDNPVVIAASWERFERCNGNLKSLRACTKDCRAFLAMHKTRQPRLPVGDGSNMAAKAQHRTKRTSSTTINEEAPKKKQSRVPTPVVAAVSAQKRELGPTYKEHENQAIDLAKDHLRIFLSNLDYNLSENDIRAALPELKVVHVDLIRSANGRSRGFGYLELESVAEVEKALGMDRRNLEGRPLYISGVLRDKEKRQKFKYSAGLEPKKLFVKGLPPDTTKEEMEQLFAPFGKVQDVRLVHHKSGKFKNIAYVEFEEEAAAGKAIMGVDQTELRDHTISVAISAPPSKMGAPAQPANVGKLLGVKSQRTKAFAQKPRMSLIPHVVRQKLTSAAAATTSTNGTTTSATTKTNADFRKLVQEFK